MSNRFPIWLAALGLFTVAFTGCNRIKLGYEYADWLVVYSVEENFDLEKPQRVMLKQEVDTYFSWHRKQMLPAYVNYLNFLSDRMRKGLRPVDIDSGFKRYRSLLKSSVDPIPEKSVALLHSLSPEQVDMWLDRQRKKNQKMRKDFSGTLDQRLAHRHQKIIDELEDWTGRLSKEQRIRIKTLNRNLPWNGSLWLETRERFQIELADLLKKKATKDEIRLCLQSYIVETEAYKSKDYQAKSKDFDNRLRGFIYSVHSILTPEQKRLLIQRVEKTSRDLRSLSEHD